MAIGGNVTVNWGACSGQIGLDNDIAGSDNSPGLIEMLAYLVLLELFSIDISNNDGEGVSSMI